MAWEARAAGSHEHIPALDTTRPVDAFVNQFAQSLQVESESDSPRNATGTEERAAPRPPQNGNQERNVALPWLAAGLPVGDWFTAPQLTPAVPVDSSARQPEHAVQWGPLLRQSAFFLGVQHGFRLATEEDTREGLRGPFFKDWYRSLSSLHGWGDGDPFYVNYIGHPMQGSVSGYIWRQNDPRYRAIEFGNNADYWRSVLRSTAFSFAYSTQFEIGPVSEATIGAVQSQYPQQGFVDHVATPTIGALWMMSEDILDRYVIRGIEGRTENVWLRMMARGWLNPTRSFANMMRLKVPWYRDSRPGIWKYRMEEEQVRRDAERLAQGQQDPRARESSGKPWDTVAPFDFTFSTDYSRHPAGGAGANCIGGGGTAVWNRGPVYSWVAEVSGCKLFTSNPDFSGDILTYRVGPRWTKRSGRWMPYGQVLVGGKRATIEDIPEDQREEVRRIDRLPARERPSRWDYVDRQQSNGFAMSLGGGLDVGLTRAAFLRLANFDYTRAWVSSGSIASYPNSIRLSMGIVLRVGAW
ncbi:MAG: hypothetical protein KIT83_19875 [Bryobacterales bacterium]|nr:hypothetical protein [Bryobacterales bacterium]